MDSIVLVERDGEQFEDDENFPNSAVWADGIGFGGNYNEYDNQYKAKRDAQLLEQQEREVLLVHALEFFVSAIPTTSEKEQKKTRRTFNRSQIRKTLAEYLVNDSMLDITKHSLFYWHSWKFLISLSSLPDLQGCIFRGGFYSQMEKLIKVAESYKKRIENFPNETAPGIQLVTAILDSKKELKRQYSIYKEKKQQNPSIDESNGSVIGLPKPKKKKRRPARRRGTICIDNTTTKESKKESDKSDDFIREGPRAPQLKKGVKRSNTEVVPINIPIDDNIADVDDIEKKEFVPPRPKKRRRKKQKNIDERPEYIKDVEPLLFDSCTFTTHLLSGKQSLTNTAINRTMLEMQSLADSLPSCLTTTSSIFVRTDSENIHLLKALIIGPDETPYSLGCFEFDLCIPDKYPNFPPRCKIVTTGNQTFRFNPNLYANGKVCLSLIGTWPGAPEEQWDPKLSTLLQVFISIQSLILVADPYYNEPGCQFSKNDAANIRYNANIRQGTVKFAILGQLKDTKSAFRDVITTHFKHKREEVIKQCETYNKK